MQQGIVKWVTQACEFFNYAQPEELSISFPIHPQVILPNQPTSSENLSDTAPVAVATGLGWVAGGPIGAAVLGGAAYLLNKNIKQDKQGLSNDAYQNKLAQLYADAVKDYLIRFSSEALSALRQYEEKAVKVINFKITEEPSELTGKRHQLNFLNTCLQNLDRELQSIN